MKEISQDQVMKNLEKCPHFQTCSHNLCPLDFELPERTGKQQDRCRFMREPKAKKIAGREVVFGGRVMPDATLNFVPSENLNQLNQSSQQRWREVHPE